MSRGDAHPLLLRGHQLQSEVVVYCDLDILFRAEITLGGLDGRVPEQKLDLFQAAAILPAELGAGAAQVVRPEPLDPDLFGALLDHGPDRPAAHALIDLAAFSHGPDQPSVFHSCGGHPGVDSLLHPYRNGDGADPGPFSFEVSQYPPPFPQLDRIDIEHGELLSAQAQPTRIARMT